MSELQYAKVGGPPLNWWQCEIVDLDTGLAVSDVVEVDAAEGWLVRRRRDDGGEFVIIGDGDLATIATERITGRFSITVSK